MAKSGGIGNSETYSKDSEARFLMKTKNPSLIFAVFISLGLEVGKVLA